VKGVTTVVAAIPAEPGTAISSDGMHRNHRHAESVAGHSRSQGVSFGTLLTIYVRWRTTPPKLNRKVPTGTQLTVRVSPSARVQEKAQSAPISPKSSIRRMSSPTPCHRGRADQGFYDARAITRTIWSITPTRLYRAQRTAQDSRPQEGLAAIYRPEPVLLGGPLTTGGPECMSSRRRIVVRRREGFTISDESFANLRGLGRRGRRKAVFFARPQKISRAIQTMNQMTERLDVGGDAG